MVFFSNFSELSLFLSMCFTEQVLKCLHPLFLIIVHRDPCHRRGAEDATAFYDSFRQITDHMEKHCWALLLSLTEATSHLLTGVESRGHSVNTQSPAAHLDSSLICSIGRGIMGCIRISFVYNL